MQSGVGNTTTKYKTKAYKRHLFAQSPKLYFSINQRSYTYIKKKVIMDDLQKINYTIEQLLMLVLSGIIFWSYFEEPSLRVSCSKRLTGILNYSCLHKVMKRFSFLLNSCHVSPDPNTKHAQLGNAGRIPVRRNQTSVIRYLPSEIMLWNEIDRLISME